jgi:type IV pilus assembly protein PilC
MIAVGEQSGQLDTMLLRAATAFESEVNAIVSSLTSILEPVLIVVLEGEGYLDTAPAAFPE